MNNSYKSRPRHKILFAVLRYPVKLFFRLKFNFIPHKPPKLRRQFILISNHVTVLDMILVGLGIRDHMYFVAGEHLMRLGWKSKLIRWAFDPIVRAKASSGTSAVIDILRRLRSGENVALFAEGKCSFNGRTDSFFESTGALVKRSGVTLVTYHLYGGYYSRPRWRKIFKRGRMEGEIAGIYPPEELAKMSAQEINDLISRDIFEDACARQLEKPIKYKPGNLAVGIEQCLVACPVCGRLGTLHSHGDDFECTCGAHWHLDEYFGISGDGNAPPDIASWDDWQKEYIGKLTEDGKILCSHSSQTAFLVNNAEDRSEVAAEGELTADSTGIRIGELFIPYSEIVDSEVYFSGRLLLQTSDKKYYDIHSENNYPGYLYYLLCKHFGSTVTAG